jgi:uncharacterized protein YegL
MSSRIALEESVKFAENPEPRCPCVLLLDTSGSMTGAPIEALNEGLQVFRDHLMKDSLASRRVEVAVVTFDSEVRVLQDFVTALQFQPPILTAQGLTHMGQAITTALDMTRDEKTKYKRNGVTYFRPWIFMITDGEPQGEPESAVRQAAARIQDEETNKGVAFYAVGVEGANMARLAQMVSPERVPLKLRGLNFGELFAWLSASMQQISNSKPGQQVALPPPGWGTAE